VAVVAVVVESLGHLAQRHAQGGQEEQVVEVLLVHVCIFMLRQRLRSLVPPGQDLLVCRAAEAEQVDQSLLQAAAQQTTTPLR
jgi:hypothetical protein